MKAKRAMQKAKCQGRGTLRCGAVHANLRLAKELLGCDLHVGCGLVLDTGHLRVLPRPLRVERTTGNSFGLHLSVGDELHV